MLAFLDARGLGHPCEMCEACVCVGMHACRDCLCCAHTCSNHVYLHLAANQSIKHAHSLLCVPDQDVSTRACYLFCRLSKSVRNSLRPYLPSILTSLEGHLARIVATPVGDVPAVQVRIKTVMCVPQGFSSFTATTLLCKPIHSYQLVTHTNVLN